MKFQMQVKVFFLLLLTVMLSTNGFTQQEIDLWPDSIPFSKENTIISEKSETGDDGILRVKNVKHPTLKIYQPEENNITGAAIIICPGGGYSILAIDHEGYQVAEWLAEKGIVGIVLKYRLPDNNLMSHKELVPLMDAQQAIRMVRQHSEEWNIHPDKIGIMGFSAGGHLASTATTHFGETVGNIPDKTSVRPDFSVLIYPVISFKHFGHSGSRMRLVGENPTPDQVARFSNEVWVSKQTPPVFLVHSTDDSGVPVENSIRFYQACVKHDVPAALHVFESGGHGYGMGRPNGPEGKWPELLLQWLKHRNIIE